MAIPEHHKELARFLKGRFQGSPIVTAYHDDSGTRTVPIGAFESGSSTFYSTIGVCDRTLRLPVGSCEFAVLGSLPWLPNAIASSLFWLEERSAESWPLVCEDTVRPNAKSTYRHMAYAPSSFAYTLTAGREVRWLLGIPITDTDISLGESEFRQRAQALYPSWLFEIGA